MVCFEQLATQYTPMIYSIIRDLHIYKSKDEYYQIGLIALWDAYQRFDPQKGSFTNYVYTSIKGNILTELKRTMTYEDRTSFVKGDYWDYIEDKWTTCPLEEEILLSYCTNAQLTENQIKWVMYTILKDLSVYDVARIEQVSPSTVKAWRANAKEKLRNVPFLDEGAGNNIG